MATFTLAAVGTAAAVYAYRQAYGIGLDPDRPTVQSHANQYRAPNNWVEALYFFTETMRYAYSETLGRWKTADLLLGLLYLSRKEGDGHPAADIAAKAEIVVDPPSASNQQVAEALEEVAVFKRILSLCCVQRLKHSLQAGAWKELGIEPEDILRRHPRAGVLRPAFSVVRDRQRLKAIVLVVRGTHSLKDMFTCLTSAVKPHHMTGSSGVVLGYSHFGMLAAARWILKEALDTLVDAMNKNPGLNLLVAGHSLGGGTAAMLTMMLRDQHPLFANARCYTIAPPSCMTLELSKTCASYVTTIIHGADVVPTFSPATMDRLRTEVAASHWYDDFRKSSAVLRVVEVGLRGVSFATCWTARSLAWGVSLPVHAVRQIPAGSMCGAPRKRRVPSSPKPGRLHCDSGSGLNRFTSPSTGQRRPVYEVSGWLEDSTYTNRIPPGWDVEEGMTNRRASWGASRGEQGSRWGFINPTNWLSGCTSARGSVANRMEEWAAETGSIAGSVASLESIHEEMRLQEQEVQQYEDAISECCEELGLNPEISLREGMSGILQEIAKAEQDEANEQGTAIKQHSTPQPDKDELSCRDDLEASASSGAGWSPPPTGASGRQGWEEQRRMYPPGRILHMAPRSVIPCVAFPASPSEVLTGYAAQQLSNCNSGCEIDLWSGASPPALPVVTEAEQSPTSEISLANATPAGVELHTSQVAYSEESMSRTPPPAPNTISRPSDGGDIEASVPEPPGNMQDKYVLFQGIPQEAYGRMKVCRQMIRDHILPSYLHALDSIQGQLTMYLEGRGKAGDYVEQLPEFCHRNIS